MLRRHRDGGRSDGRKRIITIAGIHGFGGCLFQQGLKDRPIDLVRISQPFSSQAVDGYLGLSMKPSPPRFEGGPSDRKAYC